MTDHAPTPGSAAQQKIDTSVPHSARIWNYWLGGKDNYPVDEAAGDAYTAVFPGIVTIARSSRAFLQRNITYLVAEAGIRQFLDVGTGLPTADNTHEVAQRIAPESRIVYVDNDPMVLAHARACCTPLRRAPPPTWTPTCWTPTASWRPPPRRWTSPGPRP